jgi:hypothetical protein
MVQQNADSARVRAEEWSSSLTFLERASQRPGMKKHAPTAKARARADIAAAPGNAGPAEGQEELTRGIFILKSTNNSAHDGSAGEQNDH